MELQPRTQRFEQVKMALGNAISAGQFAPADRLPSLRSQAAFIRACLMTIQRAELKEEGLRRFLESEKLRDHSFFPLSDEPHGAERRERCRKRARDAGRASALDDGLGRSQRYRLRAGIEERQEACRLKA